jgi:hypothetical protein
MLEGSVVGSDYDYRPAPDVVPAPDSSIDRPLTLPASVPGPVDPERRDPWLEPDSMPDLERSRTAPVAEPESSFFPDLESVFISGFVCVDAPGPCCVPVPVDCEGS